MTAQWDPEHRDEELHRITNLTRAVTATAVGATVLLGVGIAWGDQQRVDQADQRESTQTPAPGSTIAPPTATPTAPTPATSKAPTSKSGGS
ncbi:MAG: hypothetical protein MUF33_11570 [Candidatus Nanopelagicales bacterium]|jgi:hypothetical protein|nr:hypothetical protein [Candidatus Nanopelagicales bacterium]